MPLEDNQYVYRFYGLFVLSLAGIAGVGNDDESDNWSVKVRALLNVFLSVTVIVISIIVITIILVTVFVIVIVTVMVIIFVIDIVTLSLSLPLSI